MVPGSLGCGVSVLAATAMLAPSRAARSAIASPMPRDAPVMNRVLPCSVPMRTLSAEESKDTPRRHEGHEEENSDFQSRETCIPAYCNGGKHRAVQVKGASHATN